MPGTLYYDSYTPLVGSPGYISVTSFVKQGGSTILSKPEKSNRSLNALTRVKNRLKLLKKSLHVHTFFLLVYKANRKERIICDLK